MRSESRTDDTSGLVTTMAASACRMASVAPRSMPAGLSQTIQSNLVGPATPPRRRLLRSARPCRGSARRGSSERFSSRLSRDQCLRAAAWRRRCMTLMKSNTTRRSASSTGDRGCASRHRSRSPRPCLPEVSECSADLPLWWWSCRRRLYPMSPLLGTRAEFLLCHHCAQPSCSSSSPKFSACRRRATPGPVRGAGCVRFRLPSGSAIRSPEARLRTGGKQIRARGISSGAGHRLAA